MPNDDTLTTRRDSNARGGAQRGDSRGPLRLRDDGAGPLSWYVREATIGPSDGYGLPYAHVIDRGKPSQYASAPSVFEAGQRYCVKVGAGAKAVGFEEQRDAWFVTWHDATEAALTFAKKVDALKRARDEAARAEREMRDVLFPGDRQRAETASTVAEPEPSKETS